MRTLRIVLFISASIFLLLQLIYYSKMPDNVAVHFNTGGEVNLWLPKNIYLVLSYLIMIVINLIFVRVSYYLRTISPHLINIPQKDYWLSQKNKDQLINILSGYTYFIGLITNLFMIYLFHQIYRFNIHSIDKVSIIGVIPYLLCILGSTIYLLVRLNK